MKVALVVFQVTPDHDANLVEMVSQAELAAQAGASLVLFPMDSGLEEGSRDNSCAPPGTRRSVHHPLQMPGCQDLESSNEEPDQPSFDRVRFTKTAIHVLATSSRPESPRHHPRSASMKEFHQSAAAS